MHNSVPVFSFFPFAIEDIIFIPFRYFLLSNDNDLSGNYQQKEENPKGNLKHKKSDDFSSGVKSCLLIILCSWHILWEIDVSIMSRKVREVTQRSVY